MAQFSKQCQDVVVIDGKTSRRLFDWANDKSALHMVSAWDRKRRLVLARIATDAKFNEITAVPKQLKFLTLACGSRCSSILVLTVTRKRRKMTFCRLPSSMRLGWPSEAIGQWREWVDTNSLVAATGACRRDNRPARRRRDDRCSTLIRHAAPGEAPSIGSLSRSMRPLASF